MVSRFDVSKMLLDRLKAMPLLPSLVINGDDIYQPNTGDTYFKEFNLFGETSSTDLDQASERLDGVYQVSIYTPTSNKQFHNLNLQDLLVKHFYKGLKITRNDSTLRIKTVDSTIPKRDGDWLKSFVSINYFVLD